MSTRIRLALAVVFISVVAAFVFASMGVLGQESQRGECEQQCTAAYKECRKGPNANQAKCQEALKSCKLACKDVPPQSSPSPSVEATATPTQ